MSFAKWFKKKEQISQIGEPTNFQRHFHVSRNQETGDLEGLPTPWVRLMNTQITRDEQDKNPDAAYHAVKYYNYSIKKKEQEVFKPFITEDVIHEESKEIDNYVNYKNKHKSQDVDKSDDDDGSGSSTATESSSGCGSSAGHSNSSSLNDSSQQSVIPLDALNEVIKELESNLGRESLRPIKAAAGMVPPPVPPKKSPHQLPPKPQIKPKPSSVIQNKFSRDLHSLDDDGHNKINTDTIIIKPAPAGSPTTHDGDADAPEETILRRSKEKKNGAGTG